MRTFLKKHSKLIAVLAWLLLIFYMSSQVATTSSGMSKAFVEPIRSYTPGLTESIRTVMVRKSAHFFLYFVLGALIINVLKDYQKKWRLVGYSILFAAAYAVTDELHQLFVKGRSAEVHDVLIDTAAASLGVATYYGINYLLVNKKHKRHHIGRILAAIVAISYAITLQAVLKTSLIPGKYLFILIPAATTVIAALSYALIKNTWRTKLKSSALIILSLLTIVTNGYVYSASTSTSSFLKTVQGSDYTLESYSIVAKQSSTMTLKSSKTISYLNDDTNNQAALKTTKSKTKAEQKPANDLASLVVALDDHNVDTAVVRSSLLPLLHENDPNFYQSLKVLDTFNIRVKKMAAKKTDITKPYAIFISGIDTYGEIASISRSDVNIVVVVNPQTHKVLLVNTPRDYYVQLHGTTGVRDKLTHAGIYGIDMSRQTLEDLYQTPIDYSVRINFTSLLKIVDTIGGVDVYSDHDFTSGKYHFVHGYNQLDSKTALEFSRNRKSFENGDRTRGQNQQRVMEAIIKKVNDSHSLLKYQTVLKSFGSSFQTNASSQEVAALLKQQMNTLGSWKTESISVDGSDAHAATYSMGAMQLYVMEPNQASLDAARAKIQEYKH